MNVFKLPEGKTCADCIHTWRCSALGFSPPEATACDFAPSRFWDKANPPPLKKPKLVSIPNSIEGDPPL
jgi:hypothetical protein